MIEDNFDVRVVRDLAGFSTVAEVPRATSSIWGVRSNCGAEGAVVARLKSIKS